jgi:hypothetical protein
MQRTAFIERDAGALQALILPGLLRKIACDDQNLHANARVTEHDAHQQNNKRARFKRIAAFGCNCT